MANSQGQRSRWWQSWLAIVLGLMLCLPLGLVGLWTRPGVSAKVRWWVSAVAAAFVVLVVALPGSSPHPDNTVVAAKHTVASRPTLTHRPSPSAPTGSLSMTSSPSPTPASVPDLTGMKPAAAAAALRAAGLSVGTVTRQATDGAPNIVLRQGAGAGDQLPPGAAVDFVIAAPQPQVPDVVGLAKAAAQSRLSAAGFVVAIATTPTTSGADGVVLSEDPAALARAARGSTVRLTVSELHKPVQLASNCTPGYSPCLPPASDYDCAGGSGNGPKYVQGPVTVTGSDPYGLDSNHDGIGCE